MSRVENKNVRSFMNLNQRRAKNMSQKEEYDYINQKTQDLQKTMGEMDRFSEPQNSKWVNDEFLGKGPVANYYKIKNDRLNKFRHDSYPVEMDKEEFENYSKQLNFLSGEVTDASFILANFDSFDALDGKDGNININKITTDSVRRILA
jgi:hypothetical protein